MKNSVDLGKAFTHLFEDAEWITKMVIGSLIALVPILNFALVGYEVRVMRNVAKGEQHPMPSWNDFGDLFTEGMWLGLARIVYYLPVLVLILPMFFIFFLPFFLLLLSGGEPEGFDRLFGVGMGAGFLVMFCAMGLAMVYGLVLGFLFPAIAINYARQGTFASCFDFKAIFAFIQRNFSNTLMVWLATLAAGMVFSALYVAISFIPCIGTILVFPLSAIGAFFIYMVTGHAAGQAMAYDEGPAPVVATV